MSFRSRGLAACGAAAMAVAVVVAVVVGTAASPAGAADRVSIRITKPLPGMIRVNQLVTVAGQVGGAPSGSQVALELKRSSGWRFAAGGSIGAGGFRLGWRVTGRPFVEASWRVVVSRHATVLASTPPKSIAIGPAAVYCKPPAPPAVNIPVGDGWIVGGLYGEGGPFPGIYACSSRAYTVTATNAAGEVIASQHVAALHSYTLVVPAGKYTLASGGCHGSATVKPGRQTKANTYCLYP